MDTQSDQKPTTPLTANIASRSGMTYLTWLVMALILVVAGMIALSLVSDPPPPRTKVEKNIAQFEELVKKKPQNAAAQAGMGVALMQAGSYDKSIEHLKIAIKLKPDNTEYHVAIAETYQAMGRSKDAVAAAHQAQELNENFERAWFMEGKIFYDTGEYAKAIGPFNRSLALEPGASDIRYLLGESLEKLGKKKAAIEQYQKALTYYPDYPEPLEGLKRLGAKPLKSESQGDAH